MPLSKCFASVMNAYVQLFFCNMELGKGGGEMGLVKRVGGFCLFFYLE
jgi:hypothetical protein